MYTDMTDHQEDIIAWLIPSASHSWADKATQLPENASRLTSSSSAYLSYRISNLSFTTKKPASAIQLSFSQPPKLPGSFILGTDPRTCDVVLPKVEGISPQHCALSFDAQARLVLHDFSEKGTQVWYDWECSGDKIDHSWVLSCGSAGGFPSTVQRLTIDIQGLRFQIVVNDQSANWEAYRARVDAFCEAPEWNHIDPWRCNSTRSPVVPTIQHIIVKKLESESTGEVYLWNLERPWEPMVKASA